MRMPCLASCIAFAGLATPALADTHEPQAIYGVWGDVRQCARAVILEGGTRRAAPVEIAEGWLKQGTIWCRLTWFPSEPRANGLFASAQALCGEDSPLGYRLDALLAGEELSLIWDEALVNGPMRRCGVPE